MSMAGIKLCLVEKGRQWEAHEFPTDSLKIMSTFRMENRNLGVSFGANDALFQVYEQGDSLAAVAYGLGGGSLVNAGVMMPTLVRARRNPKWPMEWEREWHSCEASAAAMLRIQNVPVRFHIAKVMGAIAVGEIEGSSEDSMKLSINFDLEEVPSSLMKLRHRASCLACGNCLAGCPYNAKNSTDKLYSFGNPGVSIVSAGVFGNTKILFQSQMRGLKLSEALGSGFSFNGNTVAYLTGNPAPLNAYGLDAKQLPKKIFQEQPGPAISSSYTSSLGFTIQTAVRPTAYPFLLFKGITTYGWSNGCWFFHGIINELKHLMGSKSSQAVVLNAMVYDESDGKIRFEKDTSKICFSPPRILYSHEKLKPFKRLPIK